MIRKKDTMNLFEIYEYINKLERRIKKIEYMLRAQRGAKNKKARGRGLDP